MSPFRRRETLNEQLLRDAQADGPRQHTPVEANLDSAHDEPSSRYGRRSLAVVVSGAALAAGFYLCGPVAFVVALGVAAGVEVLRILLDRIRNPHGRY